MATRRWRPLALASVVLATLAGAVVLRSGFDGDGAAEPADPQTMIAGATQTSTPSPVPGPPLSRTEPVLAKRVFAAGERVTLTHGIGFLSAADGSLETWSVPAPAVGGVGTLQPAPDGALLVYWSTEPGEPPWIVERATGTTWRVAEGIELRPETAHGTLMLAGLRDGDVLEPAILDIATGRVAAIAPGQDYGTAFNGFSSPDGRKFALHLGSEVFLLESATGRLTRLAEGIDPGDQGIGPLPGALGFVIERSDGAGLRRWFSWEGIEVDRELGPGAISPGGRRVAVAWSPGRIKGATMGATPAVGAVTVYERQTGAPLARFLGAETPTNADLAWSATGDSLVIEVAEGYRLVGASGQLLASIPDEFHVLNPRPSPTIAGLLGTNRGTIINTVRGVTIAPDYQELVWRANWSTRPGELIVELSSPGKGRDWPVDVMPFEVRTRGIDSPPKVAARGEDDCVPLRERPHVEAPLVECMPQGLAGTVTATDDPAPEPKPPGDPARMYAGFEDAARIVWLHLEMDSGAAGWAEAGRLDWAD